MNLRRSLLFAVLTTLPCAAQMVVGGLTTLDRLNVGGIPTPYTATFARVATKADDNDFLAQFNFTGNPVADTDYQLAGLNIYADAIGTKRMRGFNAVNASLVWSNTHAGGKAAAVMAHVGTSTGTAASANQLWGFRTSLDHRSSGIVDSMFGLSVPQVDVEGGGSITHVYGLHIGDLSAGPGKPDVFAIKTDGAADKVDFAGPVKVGSLQLGNNAVAETPSATHTITLKTGDGRTFKLLALEVVAP